MDVNISWYIHGCTRHTLLRPPPPFPVVQCWCLPEGFVIWRGCGSWIPRGTTIDLCHCVHFQPLQRSPCVSPLLCIPPPSPLLCISCISFPVTPFKTVSPIPPSPLYSLPQPYQLTPRERQKYNFAVRFVKTVAHSGLNLCHFYAVLSEIAPRLLWPEWMEQKKWLIRRVIVSESRHSTELQPMLIQADKTHPLLEKSRVWIQTAVTFVSFGKHVTQSPQLTSDTAVSYHVSTRLCCGIFWSLFLIFVFLMSSLHRVSRAHLSAAAKDEAGQKSLCGGVCDWPGAADSRPPHGLCCGAGGRFEDRHMQPQAPRLRLLGPQQRPLVPGQHGEEHRLHAARLRSGQDLR